MKKLIRLSIILLIVAGSIYIATSYTSAESICSNDLIIKNDFQKLFSEAAIERTNHSITYDSKYRQIDYPNGDIPSHLGVCTDVIIRSYRNIGADLQKLVHEDMKNHFDSYPSQRIWGLNSTDSNIDHRRVPNLQIFFTRHGISLDISNNNKDYLPGDIVTWDLKGNSPWHIGIVTHKASCITGNPLVVHNIGSGPIMNDALFSYPITGHYRYIPEKQL